MGLEDTFLLTDFELCCLTTLEAATSSIISSSFWSELEDMTSSCRSWGFFDGSGVGMGFEIYSGKFFTAFLIWELSIMAALSKAAFYMI